MPVSQGNCLYLVALNALLGEEAFGLSPAANSLFHPARAQFQLKRVVPQACLKYSDWKASRDSSVRGDSSMLSGAGLLRLRFADVLPQRFLKPFFVIAKTVEPRRKAMHNNHQILHQLLPRRQSFLIQHKNLTSVALRITLEPLKPESHQAVAMRYHQSLYLPHSYVVHKGKELLAGKIKSLAQLLYELHRGKPSGNAEFLKRIGRASLADCSGTIQCITESFLFVSHLS